MYLIEQGVDFILYPGIVYERRDSAAADNNYNCPIVASYNENIKNNVEDLKEKNIKFMNPFPSLDKIETIIKRMTDEFVPMGCDAKEIKAAVEVAAVMGKLPS
ncbi:MAG: acyl-CoA dehydratase activase-related protein [Anaerotignum sp.]